jgi:3-oxoacyl-[acyl-carrier-protein] synthase-3
MPYAAIAAVTYALPELIVTNADLGAQFPEWGADKIAEKTGILKRHIAGPDETSADLAAQAAEKLFASGVVGKAEIDFLLFCTQTPDFLLPTSACLLQHRLGLPTSAGALDFNLGCSGYVYGLSLARGLIESGQAQRVLFLTGETYSKLLNPVDKAVRTIFGDAGSATLITAVEAAGGAFGPTVFGTDGSGGANLICCRGGWRGAKGSVAGSETLWMNGPEIFNFTLRIVPEVVQRTLERAGLDRADVDLFVFHQANRYMLDHLRKKMEVQAEKFVFAMEFCGNTVSSSIPIALVEAEKRGQLRRGMRVMLVGFGVGYSWGATLVRWR